MSVRETRRPAPPPPELDGEDEVDLGRYWSAIAARWWLPVLGLVAGALIGYLVAVGGSQTYRAQAVVNLGTPFAVGGGLLPSVQTNASAIRQIVTAESTIRRVASSSGLRPSALRGHVSATPVAGGTPTRSGQQTIFAITVKGPAPGKAARAANEFARIVVTTLSDRYVDPKVRTLRARVQADKDELASLNQRLAEEQALLRTLTGAEKLAAIGIIGIAEQRRSVVTQDLLATQPLLTQAQTVERGHILTRAVATKTTARSKRNSAVVGAVLGLLLGVLAALLWEPVARRFARRPAR
jgi:uncharacterized protein involved in exopolysaccharide biosynthesis